jgi:hypothetical protein
MRTGTALLVVGWVLVSPFVVAALVGTSGPARQIVGRLYPLPILIGWGGVLLLIGGAFSIPSQTAMLVGAPLAGLAVWTRGGGGDDGGGGGGEPPPDEPRDPDFDWDAFEHAFREYARGRRPAGRT